MVPEDLVAALTTTTSSPEWTKKQSGVSYTSKREQQLLLELYEARRDILEDKRTEFTMRGKLKKTEAYESIAKEYLTCNLT